MLISTKGRYALRIMLELAQTESQTPDTYIPLRDLAERQEISEKYLESILKHLVDAGYLIGRRGKGGGYKLGMPVHEITVYGILDATESSLAPVSCLDENGDETPCSRIEECKTRPVWEALDQQIESFLEGIHLQDLL